MLSSRRAVACHQSLRTNAAEGPRAGAWYACLRRVAFAQLALFGLGIGTPARALDPKKEVQAYVLDQWDSRHGLPFTTVRAIRQTPDGYLWFGTQSGLARFDGLHFTVFDVQNTPELRHNHVWSLAVGHDGSLWIATNGGLSHRRDGVFTHYGKEGLLSAMLRALHLGRDGSLWIGSANGGLDRWKPTPFMAYDEAHGLAGDSVLSVTEDVGGTVWIGTNHGLDRLANGVVKHEAIGDVLVWSLLAARDGSVWIGTEGGGLWHWEDGAFQHFTTQNGLPGNEVRALLEDRDGNLWAGTNYGLGRFTNGGWSRLGNEHGLSSNLVRSIVEDADGSLWIGFYGGGLSRIRDGEFASITTREGLVHDLTWGIAEGLDGSLWVSTHAGISRRKYGRWTTYTKADGVSDNITRPVLIDRQGALWVGTNLGVSRFADEHWTTQAVPGISERVIQSIFEGRDGALWFGTWKGLCRLKDGVLQSYQARDPARNDVRVIHEDRHGTLWIGATRGLARVENGTLVPYLPEAPWGSVAVEAIYEDDDGILWVGTDGAGLFRIAGDVWTAISARDGLFDDTVFHILGDDAHNLWLGGPRGVFQVSQAALADFAAGRSPRVTGTVYGVSHGMKSSECTGGGSQPGAFKDRSGRLWFPTNKGVVTIDPRTIRPDARPPIVHIEEVHCDRLPLATSGRVEAGAGRGDLEVRYAAVNFISPADVRFRYRLDGLDAAWVDAGDRRVAHYANLSAGQYRFAVAASNDGIVWSEAAGLVIERRPHFYEIREFQGLVALAIAFAALGLHRLRVRRLARTASGLRRMNDALRESDERYALAARGANDGLWDWNLKTDQVFYSPRWRSMLGLAEHEITDSPNEWLERVHPEDQARVRADLKAHLDGASPHFENEHRIRHADGEYRFVLSRGLVVRDDQGHNARIAGSQTDITLRKQAEAQILHDALHDPLTGLPNRTLFFDRLGQAVAHRRRREEYRFAVLFLDLDRFKLVNDSLGHLVGDALLVGLARRLTGCVRIDDTVARLGGDEFAILLDVSDARTATHVAERIQRDLQQPFMLEGNEVFSTASIGITFDEPYDRRPEELLRDADTAMYRAKARGRNRHEIFDEAMHSRAVETLQLETDLRKALERAELRLLFQPIVALTTGQIVSFEALVRWQHPERGLLLPQEFISLAEETGLIVPLGHWVLRAACEAARAWQDSTAQELSPSVSVNLSAREFAHEDLVSQVESALGQSRLPGAKLRLEITESLIMDDPDAAVVRCLALRELGVSIDIDDFGTGYSSLSYLRRFPVHALKIDQSFVGSMEARSEDFEIVRAIVSLAGALGLRTVAEGVETESQAVKLRDLGCELGQGHLFARPLEPEQALAWASPPTHQSG